MTAMMKKWKSRSGFSLSEMLMVVLILSLLISAIGGGVIVVKNAYEKITLKAEAQVLLSTTVTKVKDELRYAQNIEGAENPKFQSGNLLYPISFENGSGDEGDRGIIVCTPEERQQLLTDSTMSSDLTPSLEYRYDSTKNKFYAVIRIFHGNESKPYLEQKITVNPINYIHIIN